MPDERAPSESPSAQRLGNRRQARLEDAGPPARRCRSGGCRGSADAPATPEPMPRIRKPEPREHGGRAAQQVERRLPRLSEREEKPRRRAANRRQRQHNRAPVAVRPGARVTRAAPMTARTSATARSRRATRRPVLERDQRGLDGLPGVVRRRRAAGGHGDGEQGRRDQRVVCRRGRRARRPTCAQSAPRWRRKPFVFIR